MEDVSTMSKGEVARGRRPLSDEEIQEIVDVDFVEPDEIDVKTGISELVHKMLRHNGIVLVRARSSRSG